MNIFQKIFFFGFLQFLISYDTVEKKKEKPDLYSFGY